MEASAGLVAGSHNRNELVVIRREGEAAGVWVFPFFFFLGICSPISVTNFLLMGVAAEAIGESKWANMPDLWGWCWTYCGGRVVCGLQWVRISDLQDLLWVRAQRRKPGLPSVQDSLQTSQGYLFFLLHSFFFNDFLKTHKSNWRWIVGCARVEGDEEEEDVDDLENEFNFVGRRRDTQDMQYIAEGMLQGHMTYGRAGDADMLPQVVNTMPTVPLLTNGQMVPHHIICSSSF